MEIDSCGGSRLGVDSIHYQLAAHMLVEISSTSPIGLCNPLENRRDRVEAEFKRDNSHGATPRIVHVAHR